MTPRQLLCVVATLILLDVASYSSVVAAPKLDPSSPQLGQVARLELERAPADSTEMPVGIGVLIWPTDVSTVVRVRPVRVGRVGVAFPADEDTLWWEVSRHIEKADPSLLRPLEHTEPPAPSWWRQGLVALLLLLGLILLLRRWMRRTRPATVMVVERAEAPHLVAMRRLDQLARSGWLEQGRFDEWYVEGSHTLREYVGGRYRVAALDWTSRELLARLIDAGYSSEEVAGVEPLLAEADAVKFAQSRPLAHQAQTWLEKAREFVERTKVDVVYSTPEALSAVRELNAGVLR